MSERTPVPVTPAEGPPAGAPVADRRRRRRLRIGPLAAGGAASAVVLVAVGGVIAQADPDPVAAAPGAWSVQRTAARETVHDAARRAWTPDDGLRGGKDVATGKPQPGTASPDLFATARVGARSWSVAVPAPGRYAVDLLVAPAGTEGAGRFDVLAGAGTAAASGTVVERRVDPATWPARLPHHVTGMVTVSGRTLRLELRPAGGEPAVTGLSVTSAPRGAPATLLDQQFDGRRGTPPPAPWAHETGSGPWGDDEEQGYTAATSHSALDGNGNLVLTATDDDFSDEHGRRRYTSARLTTRGALTVTYGRIEARMKVPAGQGLWSSLWALGANKDQVDWPRSGEIDVMEVLGGRPDEVWGHIHALGDQRDPTGWRGQRVSSIGGAHQARERLSRGSHVYAADVQPDAVTFRIDGRPYFVAARSDLRPGQQWPVGHPYYLLLNLAVGGTWGGPPNDGTPLPGRLVVDRVTIVGWR